MSVYKIYKETTLPGTLTPNSIYLVAPAGSPNYVEMYVTGTSESTVKRIINETDIQAMIDASLSSISEIEIVADIAARDALNPDRNLVVLVTDASADATVDSGAATYVYNNGSDTWTKIAEYESMDIAIDWSDIQNGPSSTPAQIDSAVANSHTHTNKTEIDKIGEDGDGYLTYDGELPHIAWDSTNW